MKSPTIQVLPDLEAISRHAASIFIELAKNCVISQGRFAVVVSGGSTPRRLYSLLASEEYRDKIDWSRVHFFWADERCVPKDNEESNFKVVFDTLLSKISIPGENIHRIKGEEEPEKGARDYKEDLKMFFGTSGLPAFDLIILGMGEDGHTASLFPDSPSLKEAEEIVIPVYLHPSPLPAGERDKVRGIFGAKIPRITLTLPILNNASQIIFLVSDKSKADMIEKILGEGTHKERYPAGLITPVRGKLLWLIDKEAAGKILNSR